MTDHEREVVQRVLSHAGEEVRAAQRCVEVLANLFETIRFDLYPEQASRIWYVLNQIPKLERIPLYRLPQDELPLNPANSRYRWVFMEGIFPAYDLRRMSDSIAELSEMLSGVKIEDVAQSKGYERHQEYIRQMMATFDPNAKIEFGLTGFKTLTDAEQETRNEMFKTPLMTPKEPRKPIEPKV